MVRLREKMSVEQMAMIFAEVLHLYFRDILFNFAPLDLTMCVGELYYAAANLS